MLRYTLLSLFCLLGLTSGALGDIYVWTDNAGGCDIDDEDNTIDILQAGTYGFRAWDGSSALEEIRSITVNSNVTDDVTVTIAWDENGGDGATDLWEGNLTHVTYDVDLADLEISGSLGTTSTGFTCEDVTADMSVGNDMASGGAVTLGDVTGDITVIGTLAAGGDVTCGSVGGNIDVTGTLGASGNDAYTLSATSVSGYIDLGGLWGNLDLGSAADITIGSVFGARTPGNITIGGDYSDTFTLNDGYAGTLTIQGDLTGVIDINGAVVGQVVIAGDIVASASGGAIDISNQLNNSDEPGIHVLGSLTGSGATIPLIYIGYQLTGVIAVDGGLANASSDVEIRVDSYSALANAAVAINYDAWPDDEWVTGAVVEVDEASYTGNDPNNHIWYVRACKGDMNGDREVNGNDDDPFDDALNDEEQYLEDFIGLEGSMEWHGDANADGTFDSADQDSYDFLSYEECCVTDWSFCPADLDFDGDIDLTDLSLLLGDYGCTSNCMADIDGDGDVDLSDLSLLLSVYGSDCDCSAAAGGGMDGSYADISVEAYDTGGYTGGGFSGEVDHFVFDLEIEVLDPNSDDWVATGVRLSAFNDATFRLSSTATTPDAYATFVAAPWTSLPGSASASVAGAYAPASSSARFTTSAINLGWYDCASSNDGPATVMRIVIDVSEVDGADVSGGFGSVYFGLQRDQDDIKIATLTASGTYTAGSAPAEESLSGDFWVTGE